MPDVSPTRLFDLSSYGCLEVRGPDRIAWLSNLLTNDVKALTPGRGCYTAFLTPQGKVRATAALLALPEACLLICDPAVRETLPAGLLKYRITERVELTDRSPELGLLAVQGPEAPAIWNAWVGAPWPAQEFNHVAHGAGFAARWGVVGDPGFVALAPRGDLATLREALLAAGQPLGLTPSGLGTLEALRIEAGIPRYGADLDETVLLPEAGLTDAVSDTKGCYLGQEFVVRIRDRGQIHRRLSQLAIEGATPAARGDRVLLGDRQVGTITSSALVPTQGRAMALAYLSREAWEPGTRVTVQLANGPCAAIVSVAPLAAHRAT